MDRNSTFNFLKSSLWGSLFIFVCLWAEAKSSPINILVSELSANSMWINGMYPTLDLPATASVESVVAKVFKMVSFDKGRITRHKTLEIKKVKIKGSLPDEYTAVLVDTNLGRKIVLLQYAGTNPMWWSRVYDAKK